MWSQLFLKITFAKAGLVKGECTFAGFEDQINCLDFKWGMVGRDVPDKRGAPGKMKRRIKLTSITLSKRFDISSVKLLNAMNSRDKIVRARIAVAHRVGNSGAPREAFAVQLEDAYIEEIDLDLGEDGKSLVVEETLRIRYARIKLEYAPMKADGSFSNVKKTFSTDFDDDLNLSDLFG